MAWDVIFLGVAVVLFALAAVGLNAGRIGLAPAGLAFLAASFLV